MSNQSTVKYDYPTEKIYLPSKGHFYPKDSKLAQGYIDLKYPTAREEDILTSKKLIQNGTVIYEFIRSLIATVGIKLNDILECDFNALLIAGRIMAYGSDYKVKYSCPNCDTKSKLSIDLNNFDNEEFDFDKFTKNKNEFEFILPRSKSNVKFKLMTIGDMLSIENSIKHKSKMYKESGVDPSITTRLKQQVISINDLIGNDKDLFIEGQLPSIDSLKLRGYMVDVAPKLITDINFMCNSCENEEEIPLPMGKDFLWPSK